MTQDTLFATYDIDQLRVAKVLYPIAGQWHAEHPTAGDHIATRALEEQAAGRAARISKLMEEMLDEPVKYDLVAKNGRVYGSNRNVWPELSLYFEMLTGAPFTHRPSKASAA